MGFYNPIYKNELSCSSKTHISTPFAQYIYIYIYIYIYMYIYVYIYWYVYIYIYIYIYIYMAFYLLTWTYFNDAMREETF